MWLYLRKIALKQFEIYKDVNVYNFHSKNTNYITNFPM